MKIFISGSEGNIGSALKEYYRKKHIVINDLDEVEKLKTNVRRGKLSNEYFYNKKIKEIDVTNKKLLDSIFKKFTPDIIIHCAALVSTEKCVKFKKSAKEVNINGTKNIAELAKKYNSYFVNFSTTATMDPTQYSLKNPITEETPRKPQTIYGQTKLKAEQIAKKILNEKLLNLLPIFIFSRYPRDNSSEITKMYVSYLKKEKRIVKMSLENFKNYFWIDDAVNVITKLINKKAYGDFIIANEYSKSRQLKNIIAVMAKVANVNYINFLNNFEFRADLDYLHDHIGDITKLQNEIGKFEITRFEDAIREVYKSVTKEKNLSKN